ncbi:CBS domain-containing protein [Methanotorris igneus]|uniref:Zinc metalloprotease n=1 Tax=Methanotorris igneus (strain DSM 5666 / JCM 11834 / Kol 5) TaxID=880724 RepID=F6BDK6_METIK|nr:CBS domain-containing protein [Methanotorris igneus]AEF96567.1 CBS domain containing protein [Methanotorris igneus Kol 5]
MQSLRIFKVMGIPIELHITFILLLILVYFLWGLGGLILYSLLFTSVVLHELGHSYIAKKYGVKIAKIMLLPIGGVAMMDKIPREGEFKIAIAGPLVSVTLGILLLVFSNYVDFNVSGYPLFKSIGYLNILLGIFNLLPAFPMDGGRILRATLSKKISYIKATKIASTIGQYFAFMMLIFGLLNMNIILILIAIFIYVGATQEYRAAIFDEVFKKIKAKDIMTTKIIHVHPEMSIDEFIDFMLKYRHLGYPVIENGNLVGVVTINDIANVEKSKKIRDVMKNPIIVSPDADVSEILGSMDEEDRVFVVENGNLKGLISKTDVLRALRILGLKEGF